jgi:tripartite motif-containing protein 71
MPNAMKKYQLLYFFISTALFFTLSMFAHAQSNGILIKQWGEFGTGPGQFKYPTMITIDNSDNIYVVDQHNHRIQKFDSDGNFILMWGKYGINQGEFNYPYGIAVDSEGDVYVSDMNNNRIQKFSPKGEFIAMAGSYGTGEGEFKYPYGIAIDERDILYIIDAFNYRIQLFNTELKFMSAWGSEEQIGFRLYMPHEIAIASDGNPILSDRQNHRMSVFSKHGELIKRFGEFGEGTEARGGQFSEPHGVAVNKNGEIFVCDRYNFRIQMFNKNCDYLSGWITSGVLDDSKHYPIGVVAGTDGMVYITDHYAHCVQKYKP